MLAYANCSIAAITASDPSFCECMKLADAQAMPAAPAQHDKQKELSLKTDWKYIGETAFRCATPVRAVASSLSSADESWRSDLLAHSIFHPPRA